MNEWILICNNKYFDINTAFESSEVILWPQIEEINTKDTIYFYLNNPIRAIRYKCEVVEINLNKIDDETKKFVKHPLFYDEKQTYMRVKLLQVFSEGLLPVEQIQKYGVSSLQLSSKVPRELSDYIKMITESQDKEKSLKGILVVTVLVMLIVIIAFMIFGISHEEKNDSNNIEESENIENTEIEKILTSENILGVWTGSYIGMSNDKKTKKVIAIYVGYCNQEGGVKGVAEIERGTAGYYYWEGTADFEKGTFSFSRKLWLSENPDRLKRLIYNMKYDAETQSFQGYIVTDPERTISLSKAEDNEILTQFWNDREILIAEYN